jgi:hypothetical protein
VSSKELRFRRSHRALFRRVGDEVLVAVPGDGEVVSLFGTGTAIWESIAHPASVAELARTLAEEYGASPDEIAADIETFLDQLLEKRVVERHA